MNGLFGFGALTAAFRAMHLLQFALNRRHLAALAAAPEPPPRISVIIPARNEARDLEATLEALLAQDDPAYEVIVVDDRSTDATGEIAARLAARAPEKLVALSGRPPEPGWMGKPWAQRQGVERASGQWLLFIDADVRLAPGALSWARGRARALGAEALGLLPDFRRVSAWDEVLQPFLPFMVFFELPVFFLNSDRQKTRWASAGAFLLVARPAYERIGGHAAVRDRVIEDVAISGALKRSGARCRVLDGRARVSLAMYRGLTEYVNGFRKNFASLFDHPLPMLAGAGFYLAFNLVQPLWTVGMWIARLARPAGEPPGAGLIAMTAGALALLAARAALAVAIGQNPLWAFTHPLLAAVNGWVLARSGWDRFARRKIVWRGRETDARTVRGI